MADNPLLDALLELGDGGSPEAFADKVRALHPSLITMGAILNMLEDTWSGLGRDDPLFAEEHTAEIDVEQFITLAKQGLQRFFEQPPRHATHVVQTEKQSEEGKTFGDRGVHFASPKEAGATGKDQWDLFGEKGSTRSEPLRIYMHLRFLGWQSTGDIARQLDIPSDFSKQPGSAVNRLLQKYHKKHPTAQDVFFIPFQSRNYILVSPERADLIKVELETYYKEQQNMEPQKEGEKALSELNCIQTSKTRKLLYDTILELTDKPELFTNQRKIRLKTRSGLYVTTYFQEALKEYGIAGERPHLIGPTKIPKDSEALKELAMQIIRSVEQKANKALTEAADHMENLPELKSHNSPSPKHKS